MTPERYKEFVERILAEEKTLDTHYLENPEFSHFVRLANAMSTLTGYRYCGAMRQHWNCLVATGNIQQHLHTLAAIKPAFLDELYEDFKEDFKEMVPEGLLLCNPVLECREYPVPDELLNPPQEG